MFFIILMQQNAINLYFITLNIFFFSISHLTEPIIYFTILKTLKYAGFLYIIIVISLISFAGLPPVAVFFYKLFFFFFFFTAQVTAYYLILLIFFLLSIYFYIRYMRLLLSQSVEHYKNLQNLNFNFFSNFLIIFLTVYIVFSFYWSI